MPAKKISTKPSAPVEATEEVAESSTGPRYAKVWDREVTDRYKAFAAFVKEQTGKTLDPQQAQVTQAMYGKFQKTETNVSIRGTLAEQKAAREAAAAEAAEARRVEREAKAKEAADKKAAAEAAAAAKTDAKKSPASKAAAPAKAANVTPIKAAKKAPAGKAKASSGQAAF